MGLEKIYTGEYEIEIEGGKLMVPEEFAELAKEETAYFAKIHNGTENSYSLWPKSKFSEFANRFLKTNPLNPKRLKETKRRALRVEVTENRKVFLDVRRLGIKEGKGKLQGNLDELLLTIIR